MKILFPIEYKLLHHLQGNENSREVIQNILITRTRKARKMQNFRKKKNMSKKDNS